MATGGGFINAQGPDRGDRAAATSQGAQVALTADQRNLTRVVAEGQDPTKVVDLLQIAADAERINMQFDSELRRRWERSYRAYRSEHFQGSKYRLPAYAARSKLFRPKTRVAVRNAMKNAAAALFSTEDLVTVAASGRSDPALIASAKILQEDLNYRLDRTSPRGGLPWFPVAMGSVFNANLTGITVSKQYWDWKTKRRDMPRMVPKKDGAVDPQTGQPLMEALFESRDVTVNDRPMIELIPSENVMLDLAAPWWNPAQLSAYFVVRYPMLVTDLKEMMRQADKIGQQGDKRGTEWLDVSDAVLTTVQSNYDAQGVRIAREGGQDSKERRDSLTGDYSIAWVHENFFRYRGEDYQFWSLATQVYLSKPMFTEDAYPHLAGSRPYTYGYGAVEPHLIYPQSMVEALQPLQQEANDVVNLRLDSLKQALEPIAVVKSGSMFDLTQLQPGKRGAPGVVANVKNMDDLRFDQWPGPPGQAYAEMQNVNADMDDLAGTFSGSSVQTNRQLNETVGGMRLLNTSASSIAEFDLRVWVETWAEPTLRQVVHLLQYYESDETILNISGERAKVWEKYGISEITDNHLMSEVSVKVNIGMGAVDPMQKLQKLGTGLQMLGGLMPFMDRPVQLNAEEIATEIFGNIGYKDSDRFLVFGEAGQPPTGADQGGGGQADAAAKLQLEQMRAQTQMQLAQMNNASEDERQAKELQLKYIDMMLQHQAQMQQHAGKMQAAAGQQHNAMIQHFSGLAASHETAKMSADAKAKGAPAGGGGGKAASSGGADAGSGVPSLGGGADVGQFAKMMQQNTEMQQQLQQLMAGMRQIAQRIVGIEDQQDQLAKIITAPVEIIRDAGGRPVSVNRGGMVRRIERDPRSGRPIGLQ